MEEHISAQKYEFKAEIKQLLDILVHSLYTSRDIFLRELVSNASDALDKIRFESTKGTQFRDQNAPLEIRVSFDEPEKTITISDTGIGMTRDELIANIGTIAKSGSADFVKQLASDKENANNIIGKFGVGFYSVFMVASEVIVTSQSYHEDAKPIEWRSSGLGEYEVSELSEPHPRGTKILIKLKEDAHDFAAKFRLESVIKKHSNFISFPIFLTDEKINTVAAIWREPKSNISKEQYAEFYKFLSYDQEEPAEIIHAFVDAPIQFNSLMFIPKKNVDLFNFQRDNYGLDLYVRRVLIQHQNKDLLPEYLSFVKGVVDSEDLPLNISRETLQENAVFHKISTSVTSHVLNHLTKKAADDEAGYNEFWKEHGRFLKFGYSDYTNQEKVLNLLRFNSSALEDASSLTSLEQYVSRMKENQKEIYFILGSGRDSILMDPHLEIFKKKGLEVLFLSEPVDEFALTNFRKFKDFDFVSVNQTDLSKVENISDVSSGETAEPLSSDDELHFSSFIEKIKSLLGDRVKDVVISKRLSGSPACLVNPEDPYSSTMQKILRMHTHDTSTPKKVFEINKDHGLIRNLLLVFKANDKDPYLDEVVQQLFELSQLQEGDLADPNTLVTRMNKILEQASGWFLSLKK